MFDNFIYNLCDKIVSLCEGVKDRIRNTSQKNWLKGFNKHKSGINNNDTDNTGNTNTKYK